VSRKGLVFTPEGESSKDAFLLTHDQFLPSSADRVLTIKSNTRTYRFKVLPGGRSSDVDTPLRELTEAIATLRQ
jgi:hypothetical protein